MKRVRLFSLILLLCLTLSALSPAALALEEPVLHAEAVVLADMDSGNVLYEKNMNARRSPASLTKIMTGLLAVEAVERGELTLDQEIAAPSNCWDGMDLDSSNAEISPGEVMTFQDYLYCALVKSANEACNVIAVAVCGNIQNFVNRMNTRAAELGATHTHFSDTNGLSDENHYTTAYDLFLISREAMKHELFETAVNCTSYEIPATNTHAARTLHNSNALLCNDGAYGDGYLYTGASGVKTGYTFAAGYCLVSTAERKGVQLIAVVLGGGGVLNTGEESYGNFTTTINLYDWGFANFSYREVLHEGETVTTVPVQYARGNASAVLRATKSVTLLLPTEYTEEDITLHSTIDYPSLTAPVAQGAQLGSVEIVIRGNTYATVPLAAAADVAADRGAYLKAQIAEFFDRDEVRIAATLVLFFLGVTAFFLLRYQILRARHIRERREEEEKRQRQRLREENLEKSRKAQEEMRLFREAQKEVPDGDSEDEDDSCEPLDGRLPNKYHDMSSGWKDVK